jgi:large subunit ribosomal protein L9
VEVASPIKTLGAHRISVRLHPEVEAVLDLEVVAA